MTSSSSAGFSWVLNDPQTHPIDILRLSLYTRRSNSNLRIKKMNIERLKLMVKMLSEVEAGTWKLPKQSVIDGIDAISKYNAEQYKNQFDLAFWTYASKEISCGFTACAVGHACMDRRFNKLGLALGRSDEPNYNGSSSWDAVNEFFEISGSTSTILFIETRYSEHLKGNALVVQVRRRIEKLLELGDNSKFRNVKDSDGYVERDWSEYLISKAGRIYKIKDKS